MVLQEDVPVQSWEAQGWGDSPVVRVLAVKWEYQKSQPQHPQKMPTGHGGHL